MSSDEDRENVADLFGDSDEDEIEPEPARNVSQSEEEVEARPRNPALAMREDDEEEEEDIEENSQRPARPSAPPLHLAGPLVPMPNPDQLSLVRLSNILSIVKEPFNPETYQPSQNEYRDDQGNLRVRLKEGAIRWRYVADDEGTLKKQSNARIVKWSDGSTQLLLGEEVLDVQEMDISKDHSYLFVRHKGFVMQGQAQLMRKVAFRPASLSNAFHRRLAAAVDKRHVKTSRMKATATISNPSSTMARIEKEEDEKIRSRQTQANAQQRTMRRYGASRPRSYGGGLTAAGLEAIDDDAGDEYEDDPYGRDRARQGLDSRPVDLEREAEMERRLNAAKRVTGRAAPARPSGKRGRAVSSDEEVSEDEDQGRQEYEGESEEELEEEPEEGPKKKEKPSRRRGLVLSDEDDD